MDKGWTEEDVVVVVDSCSGRQWNNNGLITAVNQAEESAINGEQQESQLMKSFLYTQQGAVVLMRGRGSVDESMRGRNPHPHTYNKGPVKDRRYRKLND